MLGTSKFSAHWGHVAEDFAAVSLGITSCKGCTVCTIAHLADDEAMLQCEVCANWETEVDSRILNFPPPPHYPALMTPPSGKLSPQKITYEVMKETVVKVHSHVSDCMWFPENGKAYL